MKGVDVGNHVHAGSVCLTFSIECKGEAASPRDVAQWNDRSVFVAQEQ